MKFIHLSDICIGNETESGMRWENIRSTELYDSLRNVMVKAEEEKAGLVMISGGLFSHIPTGDELDKAADIFRAHPDITVVIIAGDPDIVTGQSPVRSQLWPGNVHYVLGNGVQRIILKKLDTEIYASSPNLVLIPETEKEKKAEILPYRDVSVEEAGNRQVSFKESKLKAVPADYIKASAASPDSESIRIAMLITDSEEELRQLVGSEFSYVAAGGMSRRRAMPELKVYAPGRFEPADITDLGEHGAMLGEISEETGQLEKISFIPMAGVSYVTLNIKVNPKTTSAELEASIKNAIEKRGIKNIYRLRLFGGRDPEESFELEELKESFRVHEIIDETEPEYDFSELFRKHPEDMIGFFISSISADKNKMSAIEKNAMYYGIEALLSTAEKEV